MTAPTKAERERLRVLLAEADPRPWKHMGDSYVNNAEGFVAQMGTTESGALIAAAVNALPGLLDALEAAEAERLTLARAVVGNANFYRRRGENPYIGSAIEEDASRIVEEADRG